MLTGFLLVIFSWFAFLLVCIALGYPCAFALGGRARSAGVLRGSLWIGLLIATILILAIGLARPLSSGVAALWFLSITGISAIAAVLITLRGKHRPPNFTVSRSPWLLMGSLALGVIYLAVAALGPVTNYDSGLYHLGAVKYASEYATIPGLANLYFPFGYNTSLYPLSAFLGNGPWGGNGFRLVNGFFILLLVADLFIRLLANRNGIRNFSVGTYFLLVAVPISLIPLVSLSDYWVTSPTSDATILVITLIAVAYLLDALTTHKNFAQNAGVAFTAAVIAFSLRPTMVVFLLALTVVLIVKAVHVRPPVKQLICWVIPAVLGLLLLGVQSVRDYLLSGWLQFPLSVFAYDVPWLAADPTWNREPTLGNARNPTDIWGSVTGFDWLGPYFSRLPSQWETYFILVLLISSIATMWLAHVNHASIRWRGLALAQVPIVASVITWFFFSPPTFRFGWGPVFSFFFVFIAFALKALFTQPTNSQVTRVIQRGFIPALAFGLVIIVGFNTAVRFQVDSIKQSNTWSLGPLHIPYKVAPVINVPIREIPLQSGLVVTSPTESDQCWDNYPLCSPIVTPSLSLRGDQIQQGFLP